MLALQASKWIWIHQTDPLPPAAPESTCIIHWLQLPCETFIMVFPRATFWQRMDHNSLKNVLLLAAIISSSSIFQADGHRCKKPGYETLLLFIGEMQHSFRRLYSTAISCGRQHKLFFVLLLAFFSGTNWIGRLCLARLMCSNSFREDPQNVGHV